MSEQDKDRSGGSEADSRQWKEVQLLQDTYGLSSDLFNEVIELVRAVYAQGRLDLVAEAEAKAYDGSKAGSHIGVGEMCVEIVELKKLIGGV